MPDREALSPRDEHASDLAPPEPALEAAPEPLSPRLSRVELELPDGRYLIAYSSLTSPHPDA